MNNMQLMGSTCKITVSKQWRINGVNAVWKRRSQLLHSISIEPYMFRYVYSMWMRDTAISLLKLELISTRYENYYIAVLDYTNCLSTIIPNLLQKKRNNPYIPRQLSAQYSGKKSSAIFFPQIVSFTTINTTLHTYMQLVEHTYMQLVEHIFMAQEDLREILLCCSVRIMIIDIGSM